MLKQKKIEAVIEELARLQGHELNPPICWSYGAGWPERSQQKNGTAGG
jgi:hypothetical protein